MNVKKVILIVGIFVAILLIVFFIALNFVFSDWSDDTIREGKESIKSNIGDVFLFEYSTRNFPDYETSVSISDISKENEIVSYVLDTDFVNPDLKILVNSSDLRCYEVDTCIVYRIKQEIFKGININLIEDAEVNGNNDLIHVSKALFFKKDWKWIKKCGGFLMKAGDIDTKKTLERYAMGQFTVEELDQNKNSEIKKEDIIDFAKMLLK